MVCLVSHLLLLSQSHFHLLVLKLKKLADQKMAVIETKIKYMKRNHNYKFTATEVIATIFEEDATILGAPHATDIDDTGSADKLWG